MVTFFLRKLYQARLLCLSIVILFSLFGCAKNANVKWVYYDETQCADKWTYTNNNESLKLNVISYMKSKGITIYKMEIFNDRTADSCTDCYCKSGRRFKCKIKKSDLNEIKQEGFYQ
jgi:hypothetical protein